MVPRRSPGFLFFPSVLIVLCALLLGGMFVVGRRLGPVPSMGVAALALLSLAGSLFLTIPDLPSERPAIRRVGAIVLAVGGIAVLIMTPFGAMALGALASR